MILRIIFTCLAILGNLTAWTQSGCGNDAYILPDQSPSPKTSVSIINDHLKKVELRKKYRGENLFITVEFVVKCDGQVNGFIYRICKGSTVCTNRLKNRKIQASLTRIFSEKIAWTPIEIKKKDVNGVMLINLKIENGVLSLHSLTPYNREQAQYLPSGNLKISNLSMQVQCLL